jgi:hypothetical protein
MSGYERVARSEADAGERSTLFDAPGGGDGAPAAASALAPPPTSAPAVPRLSLLSAGAFLWRDLVTSLRGGEPEPTPAELARRFAEGLRRDYGAGLPLAPPAPPPAAAASSFSSSSAAPAPRGPGPAWMEAAFQEAILAAETRCAPLFIYLHRCAPRDVARRLQRGTEVTVQPSTRRGAQGISVGQRDCGHTPRAPAARSGCCLAPVRLATHAQQLADTTVTASAHTRSCLLHPALRPAATCTRTRPTSCGAGCLTRPWRLRWMARSWRGAAACTHAMGWRRRPRSRRPVRAFDGRRRRHLPDGCSA